MVVELFRDLRDRLRGSWRLCSRADTERVERDDGRQEKRTIYCHK